MPLYSKNRWKTIHITILLFAVPCLHADAIGIFYDATIPQHQFAAGDIRRTLENQRIQVLLYSLDDLEYADAHAKVVIAMADNQAVSQRIKDEGGEDVAGHLGEQAYVIRSTGEDEIVYWVLGGDRNGAMYGGLQLAENFGFDGWGKRYDVQESPYLLQRGIKFNLPLDRRCPTYYSSGFSEQDFRGTSTKKAIEHVWDLSFWLAWFDEMARHRYNVLSLWSLHPFPCLIELEDYPDVALQDVQGFDGFAKKMTMQEKIVFWRQVMRLARDRGFEVYFFTWNIYTYGATGKYGISNDPTNPVTIPYMRQCMTRLLETYPDLSGLGVTAGENMGELNNDQEAQWIWSTYGQGFYDYAKAHPERKLTFIHRYHGSGAEAVTAQFQPLFGLSNVCFDFSFKYAVAHIYSAPAPRWITTRYGDVPTKLKNLGRKTWLELRNDSFYCLHWGDPDFVRRYLAGFPDSDDPGSLVRGFFMGSDGYTFTRVFNSKASWSQGRMEIERLWYTHMLWGRLGYNPKLSDKIFQQTLARRYPGISPDILFRAWSKASQGVPLMTELVQGDWKADFRWWPEACMARKEGFRTIDQMLEAAPPPGSRLASIAETIRGECGGKRSAYRVADEIESAGRKALQLIGRVGPVTDGELNTNLSNLRAQSWLSLYYAEKIRGACYKGAGDMDQAREAMGRADGYWRRYSSLMHSMHTGMTMQRTQAFHDWLALDDDVRAEYQALGGQGAPQEGDRMLRPCIWIKPSERAEILSRIKRFPWAQAYYDGLISRLDEHLAKHQADPDAFLRELPFDWDKQESGRTPPFFLTRHVPKGSEAVVARPNLDNATHEEMVHCRKLQRYLSIATDCGLAYYLTEESRYAQCATDILNAFVQGVIQHQHSQWRGRGGWLFPDDGFREVREIANKVPIVYDFVASFIRQGGRPYDVGKESKIDFPQASAQHVFRTYANTSVHYGHAGSNHSVLEASNLLYNTLALEDPQERDRYLRYFLEESTEYQDSLSQLAEYYQHEGDIWPETSQYSNHVSGILTRLMLILTRFDPSLHLGQQNPNIPMALPKWRMMKYPNGQIVRFGDGKRYGGTSLRDCEMAYALGKLDGVQKLTDTFGAILNSAISQGKFKRGGLSSLLWGCDEIEGDSETMILPRTDRMSHAGLYLQRNLSSTGDADDGLMCFVGGGHFVHAHAEGMNIELYGCGEVLGVDNGRGKYALDIHENYSRLYAAHNTVIVNGASQGEGGWANLGINTVQLVTMEPMPGKEALSPYYSFSRTSFDDDKGDDAQAVQERTLALVRTSDTTGYYVDIFRSKSKLPNEYHDYLYHNLGDELLFLNNDLPLHADPQRFQANAKLPWKRNRAFRNPGWHFFEDVQSSLIYPSDVHALFKMEKFVDRKLYMKLFIPGFAQRVYTKVKAPATNQAPKAYAGKPTPTLVIRNQGDAWERPFVVVYEPYDEGPKQGSVQSVVKIEQAGVFKGLKVVSVIDGVPMTQYIISQPRDAIFTDSTLGLRVHGAFALVSVNEQGQLLNLYLGEGQSLAYDGNSLTSRDRKRGAAYLSLEGDEPVFNAKGSIQATLADGQILGK